MKELGDIVCEIAGPLTTRTLENLRKSLEDAWLKSTQQGSTPEDQAAFTPELVRQAHEAAKYDNASTIVSWAEAIYTALIYAEQKLKRAATLKGYLETAQDKVAYYKSRPETPPGVVRAAEEEVSALSQNLRDLWPAPKTVPGHPSPQRSPGAEPPGRIHLDGDLPSMS